jgi:hypothetical protein
MTGYGAPQPQQRSGQQLPLFDLIGAGLGVLSFVWGFLDWQKIKGAGGGANFPTQFAPSHLTNAATTMASNGISGYKGGGLATASIGLSLLAAFIAAGVLLDKEHKPGLFPIAAAASSLLVTFGLLVNKPEGYDLGIGMILMLITVLAQTALFVVGWLQANGKIMTGTSSAGGGQWGGGGYQQQGYPQAQQPAQPQYGQPAQPQPQQPAQPQYGQPAQPQPQQPAQPQYGQPAQPQYGQPPQAPPGYPQQPPQNPYGQG